MTLRILCVLPQHLRYQVFELLFELGLGVVPPAQIVDGVFLNGRFYHVIHFTLVLKFPVVFPVQFGLAFHFGKLELDQFFFFYS